MKTLFLCVGDVSGDEHCAMLVRELLRRHPDWTINALAGPRCAEAGAHIIGSTAGLGVIGFASALALIPRSWKLKQAAFRWIEANKPDAAIVCDWGGFNTRILPEFKRLNIPVCYYFPPRSWQKGGEGGTQIAPFVDCVATPFEWSAQKLQNAGAKAKWVGHPILEKVAQLPPRAELRLRFGWTNEETVVVLLPGSRRMELNFIGPHGFAAVQELRRREPERAWKFVVAAPPGATSIVRRIFSDPSVEIHEGQTLELLRAADVGVVKSGTSTLEAAALDLPQVVVYDGPWLLRLQVHLTGLKRKIPLVAMPNIILDRMACLELLAENCRAPRIAEALLDLLNSPDKARSMKKDYALVRSALGDELPRGATQATADLVEEMVGN